MAEGYEPSGLTPEEFAALPPYDEVAGKKFSEVAASYGEEVAINVIIATDPRCWAPTEEELAQARPAIPVDPDLVNAYPAKANKVIAHKPSTNAVIIPLWHNTPHPIPLRRYLPHG